MPESLLSTCDVNRRESNKIAEPIRTSLSAISKGETVIFFETTFLLKSNCQLFYIDLK